MYYFLGLVATGIGGRYDFLVYLLLMIVFIYMILKKGKIIIPKQIGLLIIVLFSITYTFISTIINQQKIDLFLLLGPISAYYSGFVIMKFCKDECKEQYVIKCIFAILIGFFIHAMLNFSINIGSESRNTIDFWTGDVMSATLQGTLLTPLLATLFYTIFYINKKTIKITMFLFFIFALAYDMVIATRSVIIIAMIVFLISVFSYIIMENKIKNKLRILIIIFASILVIIAMYSTDTFEIKTKIESSNLFSRIEDTENMTSDNARINAQLDAIKNILKYPFGMPKDISFAGLSYAHNMWLDVAKETGIIPLILLIVFFILNICSLIKVINNKKWSVKLKILLISVYITFLLIFSIEPILQGIPIIFIAFCILASFIDAISKEYN